MIVSDYYKLSVVLRFYADIVEHALNDPEMYDLFMAAIKEIAEKGFEEIKDRDVKN